MRLKIKLAGAGASIVFLCLVQQAKAQEVNYGALSEMFGEPVTTSATGSPEVASQAPANMEIISADEIRRSGATDIPDILRYYAGIDVRSEGAMDNDVAIRGFAQSFNPRLLVLINGRQVYIDDYGFTAWNTLPVQLTDIRQIEVVRGPASALFGFNAASGVVNIITYDPLFDKINVLKFGFGNDGTYTGSLVSTLNVPGKGGISVQIGGLKTNEYSQVRVPNPTPGSGRPFQGSYAVDSRYKPTDQTEVTVAVSQSDAAAIGENPAKYFYTSYRITSYQAGFSAATNLGVFNLLAYNNLIKISSPNFGQDTNQISIVHLTDLFKIADVHSIRIGVEYRNNRASGDRLKGTLRYSDYAADAMWSWQIDPTLSFTAAGRVDHLEELHVGVLSSADKYTNQEYNGAGFTAPSYNIGLVWKPTLVDTFRLLTGRSVQAPSLLDLGFDIQFPAGPIAILLAGNPNLKPSVTTNYEVDYDRQLPQISSTLSTSLYYNTTTDLIGPGGALPGTFSNGAVQSYSEDTGSGQAEGGEIGLKGEDNAGFRWNAAYSLVGLRNKTIYGPPDANPNFNNSTPTSEIDFGGGYTWHQWEADAEGHWQSNYQTVVLGLGGVTYTPVTVHNYVTASARIGYAVNTHITLAVAGQQLTEAQMNGPYGLQPQRSVLFSATFTY